MISNVLIGLGTILATAVGVVVFGGMAVLYISAIKETFWGNHDGVAAGVVTVGTFLLGLLLIGLGVALR